MILRSGAATTATTNTMTTITKKGLSKWGVVGLDISDTGFSKLHSKEQQFDSSKNKEYGLENEKFLNYTDNLIEKVNRMYAKGTFSIEDATTASCFVLTEYTKLTQQDVINNRDIRWPATDPTFADQNAANKFTDEQIKASTVGTYIHNSLTDDAKRQLKADDNLFKVTSDGNEFYDGPSYFWKIAEIVDPNNDSLIENVRIKLRNLNVKDYGFSVIQMLADFKNLRTRVTDLGGSYTSDDQFLDLWTSLRTMKEKEFSRYVRQEKDKYRDLPRAGRETVDKYITKFSKKETAMRDDKEWNIMSAEDSMIMALITTLEKKSSSTTKKKEIKKSVKKTGDKEEDKENVEPLTDEEKRKRKDARIPDWKKVKPKEGETETKVVDNRTYYWCTKCRNGRGMWALHKEHVDNFTYKPKTSGDNSANKSKVSFAMGTKSGDEEENEEDIEPTIQVSKDLLNNARAYLAQYQGADFQMGGTQDE
jgi:hypothetical protein